MRAIYRREMQSYFYTPAAYVFMGVFLTLASIFFAVGNLSARSGNLLNLLAQLSYLWMLLSPVLTMRLLAGERRQHTDQLLYSSPCSLGALIGGKYLAACTVLLMTAAVSFVYCLIVAVYGTLYLGETMVGYLGLILQGCGGNAQEWLDGINEMLTEAGILQNGSTFTDIYVFQKEDVTNILFPFDGVDLNIGKLAMWRLQTHHAFYGTWLSDYVPNYLGGFIDESQYATDKPDCALIGEDGNVFNLIGKAAKTLRRCGLPEQAKEMSDRVFACGSYGEALNIIGEYVNITDAAHVREYRPSVVKKIKDAKVAEPSETPKQHKPQER